MTDCDCRKGVWDLAREEGKFGNFPLLEGSQLFSVDEYFEYLESSIKYQTHQSISIEHLFCMQEMCNQSERGYTPVIEIEGDVIRLFRIDGHRVNPTFMKEFTIGCLVATWGL